MKQDTYTQCHLIRGNIHETSWIPTCFAVKGSFIKLKINNKWEDGWKVNDVYSTKTLKEVNDGQTLHKRHRKNSDI